MNKLSRPNGGTGLSDQLASIIPDRFPVTAGTGVSRHAKSALWRAAAGGFILGALLWVGARELGIRAIPFCRTVDLTLPAALAGSLLAVTPANRMLWLLGAVETVALLLIGWTPLACPMIRAWAIGGTVQPAPAVVSLSSEVYTDGSLDTHAQIRVFHACELLGAGKAHRLVLTRIVPPWPSAVPAVRRSLRELHLAIPIDEVGPAADTHDEALAVARLARTRGWKRVILVSEPLHLRRAAAVFAHAGLQVSCSPCPPGFYDLHSLDTPSDRLTAFRDWIREWTGYRVYRHRGWL